MSNTFRLSLLVAVSLLQGCANYLYTGEITVVDREGEPRKSVLYWSRTKAWLGKPKAGHAMLLTECGVPIRYDQRPDQIVFRGTPNEDRIPGQPPPTADNLECGNFVGNDSLVDIEAGDVQLTVLCEGVTGDFSAVERSYLSARPEPYTFVVSRSKTGSFFGKVPDAPATPDCR